VLSLCSQIIAFEGRRLPSTLHFNLNILYILLTLTIPNCQVGKNVSKVILCFAPKNPSDSNKQQTFICLHPSSAERSSEAVLSEADPVSSRVSLDWPWPPGPANAWILGTTQPPLPPFTQKHPLFSAILMWSYVLFPIWGFLCDKVAVWVTQFSGSSSSSSMGGISVCYLPSSHSAVQRSTVAGYIQSHTALKVLFLVR